MATSTIALIGDYNPNVLAHTRIPGALSRAEQALGAQGVQQKVAYEWVATSGLTTDKIAALSAYDAVWCTPGSPYQNEAGVIAAIRHAREQGVPFLGTCGGFQHALVEWMRHQGNLSEAVHEESHPSGGEAVIHKLTCSLVGQTGRVWLKEGSRAARIYAAPQALESYWCNYGFNPAYRAALDKGELVVSGVDENQAIRIVELPTHPFFIATLFQPEIAALQPHPLILAFVAAAIEKSSHSLTQAP